MLAYRLREILSAIRQLLFRLFQRPYDEPVSTARLLAGADLYYIYQHEMAGVFSSVLKLQELFKAGTIQLSDDGPGSFGLYQYDRRAVLRHTTRDRMQAYRRIFGYTQTPLSPGIQPNHEFHGLLSDFMGAVSNYLNNRLPNPNDPSFGNIAVVRRAGLDLRNNLKNVAYGQVNALRVELLELLEEAFSILAAEDVRQLFGAEDAWDVVEEIQCRYMGCPDIYSLARNQLARSGRAILNWLAQEHNNDPAQFEAALPSIADDVHQWLTSAQSLPPQ